MTQVILLASLAGNDFALVPDQLVEISEAEAENLIRSGQARRLLTSEPTELQLETLYRFPIPVAIEPEPVAVKPEEDLPEGNSDSSDNDGDDSEGNESASDPNASNDALPNKDSPQSPPPNRRTRKG